MWDIRYLFNDHEIEKLIKCVKCLSVWFSLMFVLAFFWQSWFLYWLAMSAVVMIIEELYGMLRR
jgi:hypothetical protein